MLLKLLKQRYLNVRLLSITDRQNDFVDDLQFALFNSSQ
jgi:hypothetical protein